MVEDPAQPDAEPVAWRLVPVEPTPEMINAAFDEVELRPNSSPQLPNNEARRLIYKAMVAAAPPRPDASAGLIEAAGMAEKEARAGWAVSSLRDFAIKLRARAADRSGPRPDASADLNKARRAAEADFRQRAADRSGK